MRFTTEHLFARKSVVGYRDLLAEALLAWRGAGFGS